MTILAGPYYTVEEALDILSVRQSEFNHSVTQKEIQLTAYTHPRKMLLFRVNKAQEWIGMASIMYRGHMTLHADYFQSLLDGKSTNVGKGWGKLLDENGVQSWNAAYPFKRELPHNIITGWTAKQQSDAPISQYCATPMPIEFEPIVDQFSKLFGKLKAAQSGADFHDASNTKMPIEGLQLNFDKSSSFEPSCIRVPASEIERFQSDKKQKAAELSALQAIELEKLIKSGQRENQLHSLLARIVNRHPSIGAKETWALLKQ